MIPIHMHVSHWVALVCCVVSGKVPFLHADDLNITNIEKEIKQTIQNLADSTFYPSSATWIKCKSLTYFLHSNECGPRTMLALYIMSIHTEIHEKRLLLYMYCNLAQFARVWAAYIIIGGTPQDILSQSYQARTTHLDN
jgi:hypothetical protein